MNFEAFEAFCKNEKIEYGKNEPMREHTTFKTGGNADLFVSVKNSDELSKVIKKAKNDGIPIFCIGKGSDLLVLDGGIEGIVISLACMNGIKLQGEYLTAEAGAGLASVCIAAQKSSLSGLEFSYGIPGSVGGALFMNAGAYGGEISQVVCSANAVDGDGNFVTLKRPDMKLSYRNSVFKENGYIITDVTFKLTQGDAEIIKSAMDELLSRRREKQPLEYPSAGSTFKRPAGHFAGALIEKNGLKGLCVGGAMVSEKHAGFIINYNNATSKDITDLMKKVADTVLLNDGVQLEPEVITVGRERN